MSATPVLPDGSGFDALNNPSAAFIEEMRRRFPTERETDELLVRKLQRRSGPPYRRATTAELSACLDKMLGEKLDGKFEVSGQTWFTGGVSKIQMGFTLRWTDPLRGPVQDRLVVRMDPSESSNTTSRVREYELLSAFTGVVPVPRVFWLDPDGRWFPEPALIYAYVPGVTKPRNTSTGKVSGLGTVFGPQLRELLAPQFLQHLAAIHTLDITKHDFKSLDRPELGSTQCALWQLNRARRIWEEDRGEDMALMEVAANWLERNLPLLDRASVVHGDYRSGNFLFDESNGHINAWLDWERGHIGDRHRDLAWTTQPAMGHASEDGKTTYVCGLIALNEFYQRYEDASGLRVDPDRLAYYQILNCYQILVSAVATAYRVARLGKSHQDVMLTRVKGIDDLPIVVYTGTDLSTQQQARLRQLAESVLVKDARSLERLLDQTSLYLHRRVSAMPEAARATLERLHVDTGALAGTKVLVVDDDMRNIFALFAILENAGIEAKHAENGIQCLAILEATADFDAVLMDIMMPEMDGYETMRRIREMKGLGALPVIALTANALQEDRERCIEAGAIDYLTKPVDPERLLALLRYWIGA